MSLAVFDISKYVENGVVIEPVYGVRPGGIRYDDGLTVLAPVPITYTLQSPEAIQVFY
jgi:hypothetical protein